MGMGYRNDAMYGSSDGRYNDNSNDAATMDPIVLIY